MSETKDFWVISEKIEVKYFARIRLLLGAKFSDDL